MSSQGRRNRLAGESSPYLLLHQSNPVDWYPWGDEALRRAEEEQKPIFLSVGYSTCFWCHVMERESFSEPGIAELMNAEFVNVKVDREERPDLDEIYMVATQVLTGRGGWPNSVFLTPGREPYFAGTYFPPEDRHGQPGFPTVLHSMAGAWRERREDVLTQAADVAQAIRRTLADRPDAEADLSAEPAAEAVRQLQRSFDSTWGGFGGAPKFPTPSQLLLLEEMAGEMPSAQQMLDTTLDRMAEGGLFDHLGGGFHRYATDREWKVPHFEKMLYDNGLLLELYARQASRLEASSSLAVVRETVEFLGRELASEGGAFWSAIDAETDGEEGAYYVWRRDEVRAALGEEDLGFFSPIYGLDGPPFFEGDRYVLHLAGALEDHAKRRRVPEDELRRELQPLRRSLLEVRDRRSRPLTDDKILTDWNGMAIGGLAVAGSQLDLPDAISLARAAAVDLREHSRDGEGRLIHARRGAVRGDRAFLSDYAYLVRGLLALGEASGEEEWQEWAEQLTDEQIRRFEDPQGGFFSSLPGEDLLVRSKELFDGAVPSANGVAALNLLALADRTGRREFRERAEQTLANVAGWVERQPVAAATLAVASRRCVAGVPAIDRPAAAVLAADSPLTADLVCRSVGSEGWRPFELRLQLADGWHLSAERSGEGSFPQGVRLEGAGVELRTVLYPKPTATLEQAGVTEDVYQGDWQVSGEGKGEGEIIVHFTACERDHCTAPNSLRVVFRSQP